MSKKTNRKKQKATEARPRHEFKPGNRYRWRPGQSGNLEGRGVENRESWRDFLNEISDPRIAKTRLRTLMELAYRKACQGSFRHLELCVDRGFGKPSVYTENVNINANLAEMVSEARKRVEAGPPKYPPLPAPIDVEAEPKPAPEARSAAQTERVFSEPKSIFDELNKPRRESVCLSDDPMHSSWRH